MKKKKSSENRYFIRNVEREIDQLDLDELLKFSRYLWRRKKQKRS